MGIVEVMDKTRKIDDGKREGMRREREREKGYTDRVGTGMEIVK